MNFSVNDAATILTFISAVVIPFAVIWLQKVTWAAEAKFALAAGLSLVAGALTAYTAGQIVLSGSLIQNASVIFTAAQIVYYGAFRALGLEKILFPQEAVTNAAKDQVAKQTTTISKDDAKAILDPEKSSKLDVDVTVTH